MRRLNRFISVVLVIAVVCGMICVAPSALAFDVHAYQLLDEFFVRTGAMSYDDLVAQRDRLESFAKTSLVGVITDPPIVSYNSVVGVWMLYDPGSGDWYKNSLGNFPYALPDSDHPIPGSSTGNTYIVTNISKTINPAPEAGQAVDNKWVDRQGVLAKFETINTQYDYKSLQAHAVALNRSSDNRSFYYDVALFSGDFYGMRRRGANSQGISKVEYWLCDSQGRPYMTVKDDSSSAAKQDFNYYNKTENGDNINVSGNTITTSGPLVSTDSNDVYNVFDII